MLNIKNKNIGSAHEAVSSKKCEIKINYSEKARTRLLVKRKKQFINPTKECQG